MYKRILAGLAVFGQFLALFPFAVTVECVGFGEAVWWHYLAMYGGFGVFYAVGRAAACWALGGGFSKKTKPFVMFVSRIGVIVPAAAFCVLTGLLGGHSGLYVYYLPGAATAYYAGYLSARKDYSEIFTRGWFAAFFAAAVVAALLIGANLDKDIISLGMTQLCVSFGVMMITAAILTNQTNIDVQTRQRAGGKAVLPKGVRSYNALLIGGTGAAAVGLCLFAKPIASGIAELFKLLGRWILSLLRENDSTANYDYMSDGSDGQIDYSQNDNALAQLLIYVLVIAMAVLAIKFRRQIWAFIKEIFSPLFKVNDDVTSSPFVDEFSASTDLRMRSRVSGSGERELLRKYRKESDPVKKYRLGYGLFLLRLKRSAFPALPTDTTTAHYGKGGAAFGERIDKAALRGMIEQYDRVRYGEEAPDSAALERLDKVLESINR